MLICHIIAPIWPLIYCPGSAALAPRTFQRSDAVIAIRVANNRRRSQAVPRFHAAISTCCWIKRIVVRSCARDPSAGLRARPPLRAFHDPSPPSERLLKTTANVRHGNSTSDKQNGLSDSTQSLLLFLRIDLRSWRIAANLARCVRNGPCECCKQSPGWLIN